MEIERKFLLKTIPMDLDLYPACQIEQAYLNENPVVRIRKQDDDFYLTYKSKGFMTREEYNLPLNTESYEHLRKKADGNIIKKTRYQIPCGEILTIELDQFEGILQGLYLAEVEFQSEGEANAFLPPEWFGEEVTFLGTYHNSFLSQMNPSDIKALLTLLLQQSL